MRVAGRGNGGLSPNPQSSTNHAQSSLWKHAGLKSRPYLNWSSRFFTWWSNSALFLRISSTFLIEWITVE